MYDNAIRWHTLVPVAALVCFAALLLETGGAWGNFPARPEFLWCLAFYAMMRARPVPAMAAFFLCGVLRDLLLGPRLGAGALSFTAMGWIALHWRFLAASRGWIGQAILAGWAGIFVAILRNALDYGGLAHTLLYRVFFLGVGDGALTCLAYLPLAALFSLAPFRPWREEAQ